jgi:hypothetical protein
MKSYTDLEQSKRLAEFLPLESADMFWLVLGNTPRVHVLTEPLSNYSQWESYPCWSLAALINILPNSTDIVKNKADTENEKYMCTVGIKDDIISTFGKNPVDACYEMIIKLYEQKLL